MMKNVSLVVLWQWILCTLFVSVTCSQTTVTGSAAGSVVDSARVDSQLVFHESEGASDLFHKEPTKLLQGILRGGAGFYTAAHEGTAEKVVQPTLGFDFYAMPGGIWGLLFGGTVGFTPSISTSIHFGLREPLISSEAFVTKLFLDGSILFSQDGESPEQFQTGGRLALSALIPANSVGIETRLVAEYRGSRELLDATKRQLWWAGAEVGISFSILGSSRTLTRQDSILSAIRYIATPEEVEDFRELKSQRAIEEWLDVFWRKRALDPRAPRNDARALFESRVQFVNAHFGRGKQLGVETEPGKQVLLLGQPVAYVVDYSAIDPNRQYMLMDFGDRVRGYQHAIYLFYSDYNQMWRLGYSNVMEEGYAGSLPLDLPSSIRSALPPLIR